MKKSTRPANLIPSSRWAGYATAGLATAFGGAGAVEAEIHYSGPVRQVFDAGSHSTVNHYFNLTGGARLYFQFARGGAGRGSAFFKSVSFSGSQPGPSSYPRYVAKLNAGDLISDGNFLTGFGTIAASQQGHGLWKGHAGGFIGFRFDTGSGFQYGWARLRKMPDNSFILLDYAWGDPGDAVTTGQRQSSPARPEEGSLGWLALGAAGLTAWRQARGAGRMDQPNDSN